MIKSLTLTYASFLLCVGTTLAAMGPPKELFSPLVAQKVAALANAEPNPPRYPQYTDRRVGSWQLFTPDVWTTGFFPSMLYAMNTRAQLCPKSSAAKINWLSLGRQWSTGETGLLVKNGQGHDQGFLSFPFGDELAVNPKNKTAIGAVNRFADLLAVRFSPVVGCTRSWDTADPTDFTVIIDNMMNLELLFQSADLRNNDTLRQIAISHADTTMKHHLRADYSSYHVVEYNSTTGSVIRQRTAQGYADNSTWTRGQAWGIYGFANMYRRTSLQRYLQTSRGMADLFLRRLQQQGTGIPPWDFDAPMTPPRPEDSSAGTLAAQGLLLLASVETDKVKASNWTTAAIQVLSDTTRVAWKPTWQSLLSNGTVNNPVGNNLTGTVYGDYYFVQTGNELLRRGIAKCNNS